MFSGTMVRLSPELIPRVAKRHRLCAEIGDQALWGYDSGLPRVVRHDQKLTAIEAGPIAVSVLSLHCL